MLLSTIAFAVPTSAAMKCGSWTSVMKLACSSGMRHSHVASQRVAPRIILQDVTAVPEVFVGKWLSPLVAKIALKAVLDHRDQKGIASFILELLPLLTGDLTLVGFGDVEGRGAFWWNNVVALGAAIVIEVLWVLFSIMTNHVALCRMDGPALGAVCLVLAEVILEMALAFTHVLARLFATLATTLKPIRHPSSRPFVALCGRFDGTNGLEDSFAEDSFAVRTEASLPKALLPAHVGEMFLMCMKIPARGCTSVSEKNLPLKMKGHLLTRAMPRICKSACPPHLFAAFSNDGRTRRCVSCGKIELASPSWAPGGSSIISLELLSPRDPASAPSPISRPPPQGTRSGPRQN